MCVEERDGGGQRMKLFLLGVTMIKNMISNGIRNNIFTYHEMENLG